jgi:dolichyl-diphosphooligosaccharide--protein glycosyltransferase
LKEKSKSSSSSTVEKKGSDEVNTKFIGCYTSEASFSSDKKYDGDSTGANYRLALHHAKTNRKRYFAVARNAGDGHAFAFNELKTKPTGILTHSLTYLLTYLLTHV